MKIKKLTYWDKVRNWGFTDLGFDQLVLFIGASGTGKSQILKAIITLSRISRGLTYNGVKWDVTFEQDGIAYKWAGEFENSSHISIKGERTILSTTNEFYKIKSESLLRENETIFSNDGGEITYKNSKLPALRRNSTVHILKNDGEVSKFYEELQYISLTSFDSLNTNYQRGFTVSLSALSSDYSLERFESISTLRNSRYNFITKLYLGYITKNAIVKKIQNRLSDVFQREFEIRFISRNKALGIDFEHDEFNQIPFLQLKEEGVKNWMNLNDISAGMLRTLIHICQIELSKKGSIFLIDEFENGLGINCISEITSMINESVNEYQFILTSHHPYIINNMPVSSWQLVFRENGKLKVSSALKEGIIDPKSNHDYFTQLIQNDRFLTGV
jgi:energy-coupling factor transporter ATP-binding protein EcfA2